MQSQKLCFKKLNRQRRRRQDLFCCRCCSLHSTAASVCSFDWTLLHHRKLSDITSQSQSSEKTFPQILPALMFLAFL